jgi:ankyrin repeat domain-containing protein 50
MANADCPESTHTSCLSILTSCFRPSGQSKSPGPKTDNEQTTSAQNSGTIAVNPTTSSSGLTPNQILRVSPIETAVPVHDQSEDFELAELGQGEDLSASTVVSKLWQEALEQSDEETKKKIKQLDKTENLIQIEQLINLIRDKRDAFKADTPSINIHGKEVIWRDCAARVINVLTILGDVASQFAPSPSSAVWSALKVLLKVTRALLLYTARKNANSLA